VTRFANPTFSPYFARMRKTMDVAASAREIVEALKETEAESEAARTLSARAVDLLHQAWWVRPAGLPAWVRRSCRRPAAAAAVLAVH